MVYNKKGFTLIELILVASITALVLNTLLLVYNYNRRNIEQGISDIKFITNAKPFLLKFINELHSASKIENLTKSSIDFLYYPPKLYNLPVPVMNRVMYKLRERIVKGKKKIEFIRIQNGKEKIIFSADNINTDIFRAFYYSNKENRYLEYKFDNKQLYNVNLLKIKFKFKEIISKKKFGFDFSTYIHLDTIDGRIKDKFWLDVK